MGHAGSLADPVARHRDHHLGVGRGRTSRHALEALIETERFDAVVIPAATSSSDGFSPADVAWALESAPGEVLVLRPERE